MGWSPIYMEILKAEQLERKINQVIEDSHGKPMLDAMRDSTLLVAGDAKRFVPVDTGRLRASITPAVDVVGPSVRGIVGTIVKYAPFVETGTKPHWPPPSALVIWARRHGTNAFAVARAIARRGTKPREYLKKAFEKNKTEIQNLIGKAVEGIVKK